MNTITWTQEIAQEYAEFYTSKMVSSLIVNEKRTLNEFIEKKINEQSLGAIKKPPTGATPKYIWMQQRYKALQSAIERYNQSGHAIPEYWHEESVELFHEISKEESIRQNKSTNEPELKVTLITTNDGMRLTDRSHPIYAIKRGSFKLFVPHHGVGLGTWLNGWYTTEWLPNPKENDERVIQLINENYLIFSTKEAAERYILENEPRLSLNDCLKIVRTIANGETGYVNKIYLTNKFTETAKNKINEKPTT